MLYVNGIVEILKFCIILDYLVKKLDIDMWEDGINGGLFGIIDLLLWVYVMVIYLFCDWVCDWGFLCKFDILVDVFFV